MILIVWDVLVQSKLLVHICSLYQTTFTFGASLGFTFACKPIFGPWLGLQVWLRLLLIQEVSLPKLLHLQVMDLWLQVWWASLGYSCIWQWILSDELRPVILQTEIHETAGTETQAINLGIKATVPCHSDSSQSGHSLVGTKKAPSFCLMIMILKNSVKYKL